MSVLVFAESTEGAFKKSTFEAVSFAKEIAKQRGINVTAVSIGNVPQDQLNLLGKYGADQVYTYNKPETAQFNAQYFQRPVPKLPQQAMPLLLLYPIPIRVNLLHRV